MAESDRIEVIFGGRIGELLAGVAEAKEALEGLCAPIDAFIGGLGGIAEAVGGEPEDSERYHDKILPGF